jgi:cyclin-dependent kinase
VPDSCDLRYEKIEKIGEGTYGVVYKARDTETNEVRVAEHLRVIALDCRAEEDQT